MILNITPKICLFVFIADATRPADSSDKVLEALQSKGATIHSMLGEVSYDVYHPLDETREMFTGSFSYTRGKDATKMWFHLTKYTTDKVSAACDRSVVFDGQWLIDSDKKAKVYRKIQLATAAERNTAFQLGTGSLPLPIGQDPTIVKDNFDVTVEEMPSGLLRHVLLKPHAPKQAEVKLFEIWIDKNNDPVRLSSTALNGDVTTFSFWDVKYNENKVDIPELAPPAPGSGWTVSITPKE